MLFEKLVLGWVSCVGGSCLDRGTVGACEVIDILGLGFYLLCFIGFLFSSESSLKSLAPGSQRVTFATDLSAVAQVSQVHELLFIDNGWKADVVTVPRADFYCAV